MRCLRDWDAIVANFAGKFTDALGDGAGSVIAPIQDRPDFEHLEAKGIGVIRRIAARQRRAKWHKRLPAHICFVTDTPVPEVEAHLERCGVPIRMQGPRAGAIGTLQSVYIDDPDGHSIEISTY